MKRFLKSALISFIIFAVIIGFTNVVWANDSLGNGLNGSILNNVTSKDTTLSSKFDSSVGIIFGTLYMIMRVVCIGGIVVQGVRYMYAESGAKAKIKQSLIYIIIGTAFVFAAGPIIDKIVAVVDQLH